MMARGDGAEYLLCASALEEAVGVPLLAELALPTRSSRREAGLTDLRPDPRVADRLFHFAQADPLTVALVGLGESGEEWSVAVGLAERAASSGYAPVLLLGLEGAPANRAADAALRPVVSPTQQRVLEEFHPLGCGALAAGIQGVFQSKHLSPQDAQGTPLEPGGIVIALRGLEDIAHLPPDLVTGVILVVPYRDVPVRGLAEQVTKIVAMGYPVLGAVAVTAAAALDGLQPARCGPPSSATLEGEPETPGDESEGGAMEKDWAGDSRLPEPRPDRPIQRIPMAESSEKPAPMEETLQPSRMPETAERAGRDRFAAGPSAPGPAAERSFAEGPLVGEPPAPKPPEPGSTDEGGASAAEMKPLAAGKIPVRKAWTDSFGPSGRKRRGLSWWGYVLLVLVLGSAATLLYRMVGMPDTSPAQEKTASEALAVTDQEGSTAEPVNAAPAAE